MKNSLAEHVLNAKGYLEFNGDVENYINDECNKDSDRVDVFQTWSEMIDSYFRLKDDGFSDDILIELGNSVLNNDYR